MTILIAAPVAPAALTVMSPAAWIAIVTRYANTEHSVFATQAEPTVADCTAAKAIYLLRAPFALAGDLAQSTSSTGRISAHSHVTLLNCLTQKILFDRTIDLTSATPPDTGDLENPPAVSWDTAAARALAGAPLPLGGVGRIHSVREQIAIATFPDPVQAASSYRVFAHADGTAAPPTVMPLVAANGTTLTLLVLGSQPQPHSGDYIEPVADAPASR